MKEMQDKQRITLEDNKKLKMKNSSHKDQVGNMKKTVSEANKVSDELKITNETLNIATNRKDQLQVEQFLLNENKVFFFKSTQAELEETEEMLTFDQDTQLRRLTQEKVADSQVNDMLRAKLLLNDYKMYSEILDQVSRHIIK